MKSKLIFVSLILLFVLSCKKEKPDDPNPAVPENELEVSVHPFFGSGTLVLDSTYLTDENYAVQFTDINFYVSKWHNGTKMLVDAALFNFREKGNAFFKVVGSPADFANLNGNLGIDSLTNHSDPSSYSSSSPLNIINAGQMHWGWNPGYIFVIVEARVDTIPDGNANFDHLVAFHIGTDLYRTSLNFTGIPWTQSSTYLTQAKLKIDLKQFLNSPQVIDLKTEFFSHSASGQEALSSKVIQNFASALSFY